MHIVINGSFYHQPNTGSGQYLHGLLQTLPALAPQHRFTVLMLTSAQSEGTQEQRGMATASPQPQVPTYTTISLAPPAALARSANLQKLWFEQIAVPQAAQRLGADLLHIPYFAPPLFSQVPVIVSVLDVIPLILPEYRGSTRVQLYMRLVSQATRRARHVIAISHSSQHDIVQQLAIPSSRITVTHLAAGSQYTPGNRTNARHELATRYGITTPFIYYVGGHDARKNVATLVRGYAEMRRSGGPDIPLIIAGRALGSDPILFPNLDQIIHEEQVRHWVTQLEVPSADNALFYQAAQLFAAPSAYEGFGLPPLEAMACGTPVVAANASSTPEVVGDAAICVDPYDPKAWATAIHQILEQPELWHNLQERGLIRAQQFSYQHTAMQTLQVYEAHAR